MEILKHGKMIKEVECPKCHCLFTYNKAKDIRYMYNYDREHTLAYSYVPCPECNAIVKVDEAGE
jgi:ssDNA-binding Zn-finger/Zn-ribbon topoisomerase 1